MGDCPRLLTISLRLSSQVLSALSRCITLSRLPCRTSLILTDPILTSLSRRKSNNRNRPSSLSSLDPEGKAESGIGGMADLPIMSSASLRIARPPNRGPAGSVIWSDLGKCELAHSTRLWSAPYQKDVTFRYVEQIGDARLANLVRTHSSDVLLSTAEEVDSWKSLWSLSCYPAPFHSFPQAGLQRRTRAECARSPHCPRMVVP